MLGLLLATVVCAQAQEAKPAEVSTERLNVLFIVVDDLNRSLGCYGQTQVRTPNIDRLASRGVCFERAYCQYPVCAPSRTSFLSGRRPEATGVVDNSTKPRTHLGDAVFLPEHFRGNGYFTARVGKVFHIGMDDPQSWDVTEEGTPENKVIYQPSEVEKLGLAEAVEKQGRIDAHPEGRSFAIMKPDAQDGLLIDPHTAERIGGLIEEASKGDRPFFIAAGFRRPHLPLVLPNRFYQEYDPAGLSLPVQPASRPDIFPPRAPAPMTAEEHREALRLYYAAVSFADAQVGKLLAVLDRLDLWKSTAVVLIGDNGYLLGHHGGWWGKGLLLEQSTGVPLLMVAPGTNQAGARCPRPVEFVDLYPTLVDLCGMELPSGPVGRSLRPLLENPQATWDHPAFTVVAQAGKIVGRSISTQRYRYIEYEESSRQSPRLYDLKEDPGELENLAEQPGMAAVKEKLRLELRSYVESNPWRGK